MNDLPSFLPYKSVLYADDTTFITKAKNIHVLQEKNREMHMSSLWFQHNKLTLNDSKTIEFYFNLNSNTVINNNTNSVKLLGIHMDAKLNWSVHTDEVCKKLSRVMFLLRKLKSTVGEELLITAYYAFFHPHLLYGNLFWGNSAGATKVFKWQKKAIRCIKGVTERDSCRLLFRDYKIMTLPSLFVYYSLMYIKDNSNQIITRTDIHEYNTRQKHNIETPYLRLSKSQKSYLYTGMKFYNLLPLYIREMNLVRFEKCIKNILKKSCLYSVNDFEIYVRDNL
jgi:hypothetical protein